MDEVVIRHCISPVSQQLVVEAVLLCELEDACVEHRENHWKGEVKDGDGDCGQLPQQVVCVVRSSVDEADLSSDRAV